MRIKVCGNTALDTTMMAVAEGADMVGFIMATGTPRTLTVDQARAIVRELPPTVDAVGVFVDRPIAEVEEVAGEVGFTVVQLHGAETWAESADLPMPVIKAVRLGSEITAARVGSPPVAWPPGGLLLADAHAPGRAGGTGRTFPWEWAADLGLRYRLLLSGGLSGDNVGDAVRQVRPWGVDASSRLESSPGVKDPDRVRRYIRVARRAEEGVGVA
ncbi:MAG TPA: phosphoribosylanthranilate isomerase [Candidatus Dormibacteraeota bacterium]